MKGSSKDWEVLTRGLIKEWEENNSGTDIFHFDSDEDIFCVFSQYIDDLMLLAKIPRAACNDEKSNVSRETFYSREQSIPRALSQAIALARIFGECCGGFDFEL